MFENFQYLKFVKMQTEWKMKHLIKIGFFRRILIA